SSLVAVDLYTSSILVTELLFFFFMLLLPPTSTLFPYTTLFRSPSDWRRDRSRAPPPRAAPRRDIPRSASQTARCRSRNIPTWCRSEEHTSELQSHLNLVCRLLLEKKKQKHKKNTKQSTTNTNHN